MPDYDVLKVAGNDGNAGATTVFVMKSSDGTRDGALMLLGTAAIVPNVGAIRGLAGEFAFTAQVPRGTLNPRHIVVFDNLDIQITPRAVTLEPTSASTVTGTRA